MNSPPREARTPVSTDVSPFQKRNPLFEPPLNMPATLATPAKTPSHQDNIIRTKPSIYSPNSNKIRLGKKEFEYRLRHGPRFPDHYNLKAVQKQIAAGTLLSATLRTNKNNPLDSYATLEALPPKQTPDFPYQLKVDSDIYICGPISRNRACNGDVVAIKLLSENQKRAIHKIVHAGADLTRAKIKNRMQTFDQHFSSRTSNLTNKDEPPLAHPNDISSHNIGPAVLANTESQSLKPLPYGTVVAVLKSRSDTAHTIGVITKISTDKSYYLLSTKSENTEDLLIPADQLAKFVDPSSNPISILNNNQLYIAEKVTWYSEFKYPIGKITKKLTSSSFTDLQNQKILCKYGIFHDSFSKTILDRLPPSTWEIPGSEFKSRIDLTNQCIFTIDPPSSRDLDDALSCWKLDDSFFCVGVHIADVSYFVKQGSELDIEAQDRSTTVYLVNRAIQMIPERLSSDLCSLIPGKNRLAVSVVWKITQHGEIVDTWIGKTVIHSACKLSYNDAQRVIDGDSLISSSPDANNPEIYAAGGHLQENPTQKRKLVTTIENSIRVLAELGEVLRKVRYDAGCLSLNRPKLSFILDDQHEPVSPYIYNLKMSNYMIEELMLLANISIAKHLYIYVGNHAFLRRHPMPLEDRLQKISTKINKLGYRIDVSSSGNLQASINQIPNPSERLLVESCLVPAMKSARYFCAHSLADDISLFKHYALNVPIYTHFTSPIRRYPDIIAHRLLLATLNNDHGIELQKTLTILTTDKLTLIANNSNARKENAHLAQLESTDLYLYKYLSKNFSAQAPKQVVGYVSNIFSSKLELVVPELGLETEILFNDLKKGNNRVTIPDNSYSVKLKMWKMEPDFLSVNLVWIKQPSNRSQPIKKTNEKISDGDLLSKFEGLNLKPKPSLSKANDLSPGSGSGSEPESEQVTLQDVETTLVTNIKAFSKISLYLNPTIHNDSPKIIPSISFPLLCSD